MDPCDRLLDVHGRTLQGCLTVIVLQLLATLSWGPGVEAECVVRLYYNLSAAAPSYVDQTCAIACCGHYPNIYCCDQCDSTFRNADGHLGSGAVAGIILGVLISLVIIFVIFVYVYGRWRRDKDPVGRAMYRLYRMSTRRRRRPKPQTGQNGQTSPNGPSTISVSNGGTQNRAFSEEQGNYPRSRRRAPATAETPMHQEQLSKPPRPGHLDSRRTDTNPSAPSEINNIQGDPPPKYGNIDSPQGQNYLGSTAKPSIPVHELDTRRLENQPNTSYKHLPLGGNAQSYEPEKVTRSEQHRTMPDITKAHTDLNDKSYQALGKRQDEHTYTTPTNVNQRDRYELPKDRRERHNLTSDSRLGPPSQSRQYNGDRKTSQPSDRQFPHLSDKQTEQHSGNRNTSHPTHPSDKNTSYHPDRQISHPSNRDTSHTSHPPNTSYPSDRQTSHPSTNTNKDAQYLREPRPSYPSTNDGRGGPGYHAYNPSPGRGAPPRQPEYESSSSRQGNRDYRPTNDYRSVNLGKPGGTRQSQI